MQVPRFVSPLVQQVTLAALAAAGCATTAAHAQTVYNNGTGTNEGYYYSLYTSSGSATMTFPEAGTYPGNYAIS